jgi:hypothetical protein
LPQTTLASPVCGEWYDRVRPSSLRRHRAVAVDQVQPQREVDAVPAEARPASKEARPDGARVSRPPPRPCRGDQARGRNHEHAHEAAHRAHQRPARATGLQRAGTHSGAGDGEMNADQSSPRSSRAMASAAARRKKGTVSWYRRRRLISGGTARAAGGCGAPPPVQAARGGQHSVGGGRRACIMACSIMREVKCSMG